jgi:poly-gamma-glutamate capsule biosynthesis protein CapA/YwtB (metallophosphatase superfamily)
MVRPTWRTFALAASAVLVLAGCVARDPPRTARVGSHAASAGVASPTPEGVTLLFAGDTMLGRGVTPRLRAAPGSVFAGIRSQVRAVDLAAANLESPLTRRPHAVTNPNALEAAPASAESLTAAGFDAMDIANNHAGDAGPRTVADTVRALRRAGLAPLGQTAPDGSAAATYLTVRGVSVAFLAFDASRDGVGPVPPAHGVAGWRPGPAREAVRRARRNADVVTVALHGGVAFGLEPDPHLARLAHSLARWGADVVWCSGPHAIQAVGTIDPDGDGRPTVVATSLGNLLFDGGPVGPPRGAILQVWVGPGGVSAYRAGLTTYGAGRVRFLRWLPIRRPG